MTTRKADMMAHSDNWIVPKGTKVVLLQQKDDLHGKGFIKPGTVGVIHECPESNEHSYLIMFPLNRVLSDKEEDTFQPEDRIAKAKAYIHEFTIQKEAVRKHLEAMRSASEQYHDRVVYRAVMGSTAYGLKIEGSDCDYKGIFVAPTDEAMGLYEHTSSFNGKIDGDDFEYKEMKEMLLILLGGNSTYIETLWAPNPEIRTAHAQELIDNRHRFVSKNIFNSYGGYAISQFQLLARGEGKRWHAKEGKRGKAAKGSFVVSKVHGLNIGEHDYEALEAAGVNWKHASQLIRLLIAGAHAMSTGDILVDFTGHEYRDTLISIKKGLVPLKDVFAMKDEWVAKFNEAYASTKLPDVPDAPWANDYLVRVRRAN
jgi:hypothetical protein